MRVSEMRDREDFDAVLGATLTAALDAWYPGGGAHRVTVGARGAGQPWRFQPLLSAFTIGDGAASPAARRYLADSFRHTPVARRRLAQRVVGAALGTRLGLRAASRVALWIDPPLPGGRDLVIVPGNQRVRLFDFAAGRTRVALKEGFDPASMQTELAVRTGDVAGPFLPVLAHGEDPLWLEEPILDAWALPRCPPHVDKAQARREALDQLASWLDKTASTEPRADYVAQLSERLSLHLAAISERFAPRAGPTDELVADLRAIAQGGPETIELAHTHGDLQPGNILVGQRDQVVHLIDWEHAAVRMRDYDRLVLTLGSRSAAGLAERLAASDEPAHVLALFLLEDLTFFAHESLIGPYTRPSLGLELLARAARAVTA